MRIKNLLAISLASFLGANTSFAYHGDFNFLLGVQGGAESRKAEFKTSYYTTTPNDFKGASVSVTDSGTILGLLGGLQWNCDRWVLGFEASVDFQSFEKHRGFTFAPNPIGPGATPNSAATLLYDRGPVLSFGGRIGWWVTPFYMPYVKFGGQYSEDEMTYNVVLSNGGRDLSKIDEDVWGWNLGLGVEFPAFGPSTIRVEAVYNKTDDVEINDGNGPVWGKHKYQSPRSYIGRIAWVWNFNKI